MKTYQLYCDELKTFTPHTYVCERFFKGNTSSSTGWEQIYKCEKTGNERRYGLNARFRFAA